MDKDGLKLISFKRKLIFIHRIIEHLQLIKNLITINFFFVHPIKTINFRLSINGAILFLEPRIIQFIMKSVII